MAGRRKQTSLALRIFNIYLLLTLTNLVILWLAAGANQIQLINKNALLNSKIEADKILQKLKPFIENEDYIQSNFSEGQVNPGALEDFKEALAGKGANMASTEFALVSSLGPVLFQNFSDFKIKNPLSDDMQKKVFHALQLRELNQQRAYRTPEVIHYFIEIFIPLSISTDANYVFYSRIAMPSIEKEVRALIILAIVMVILILVVQTIFGLILYRMVVVPIKSLSQAAEEVSEGNLETRVTETSRNDSLGRLIEIFNRMVESLSEKTGKLENTIAALESHDRMLRNELVLAEQIQRGIMPQKTENPIIHTAFYYAPMGKVSGDYYDLFETGTESVGVLLADISGHGMPAALVSIMAKIHFNENAGRFKSTAQLLKRVNHVLAEAIPTSEYLTAFYLIIDKNKTLRYCNSAHQPALFFEKKTGKVSELTTRGSLMGAFIDPPPRFSEKKQKVAPGDRILLYTDGITESMNPQGEVFGKERLKQLLIKGKDLLIEELKFSIIEEIHFFLAENNAKDDQTLLILEVK